MSSGKSLTLYVFWLVGALTAMGYFILLWPGVDFFWGQVLLKPIPILMMALWVLRTARNGYGHFVAAGLLLAMIADVVLLWPEDNAFLGGLALDLLAHLCYIVAFTLDNRSLKLLRALPYFIYTAGLYVFLYPGIGPMSLPVALYSLAIMAMMWRAGARVGMGGTVRFGQLAAAGGAILFAASDSLIALHRFHEVIPHVSYPIMVTYWLGQLGIAISAGDRKIAHRASAEESE